MAIDRGLRLLLLALGAMFAQQTFASIGRGLPAVVAPVVIADLHLDAAWLGTYASLSALAALTFQLGCGSFLVRHGALRLSQVALVMLSIGLAAGASGHVLMFAISAIIGGGGAAVSTPASSHLLGRYCPPRIAPLVYSVKQTAVPAGLLLAGLLGPALILWVGWRGTLLVAGGACLAFALLLQPLRREFDADRTPSRRFSVKDFGRTIGVVTATRELRTLSMACFAFNGLQSVFTFYFIVFLTRHGQDLAAAGALFSLTMMVAMPCRILWGWLGSLWVAPRVMMAVLAFGMAASTALLGLAGETWPIWVITALGIVLSATAMSWHGVLLAETARLAPDNMHGAATGGVLSFGQIGAFLLPLAYSLCLSATGSHGVGFIVSGVPALLVAVALLRGGGDEEQARQEVAAAA
ncbi:MFS transporter [Siccirubricoccus sp. KC 17139]|uniref:MFS transporter n=1 Tax=Siccirubricoccus soli TaxID=2899147 RepID=A0ABT1D5Z9_9PROT|nr:MFS transporter [Siccirubricoccus soli]MCO6417353.1 MFS transporter [Siccirubricoccus soli]MCP2683488.1 MFS transporter [Siccirubricoccus soli]